MAHAFRFQVFGDIIQGCQVLLAIEWSGIDQGPLTHIGLRHCLFVKIPIRILNDDPKFQTIFFGKFKIPLIMGGDGHNRPGSIFKQDKIGHKYGDLLPCYGIYAVSSRKDPFLCGKIRRAHVTVHLEGPLDKVGDFFFLGQPLHNLLDQGMFRGEAEKGGAKDRILPRGECVDDLIGTVHGESDDRAITFSDPVFLHGQDPLRPSREPLAVIKDLIGIFRYLQEPAVHLLDGHFPVRMAPAAAILYLFIGKDALAAFTPVDVGLFLVGQALLIHLQEHQLFPTIIRRVTCGQLAVPIVTETHSLELFLHGRYVIESPFGRMGVIFYGRVFCGHSKGIPSHGVQNIFSAHPHVSGYHIPDGIIAHVTNMDSPGRVRKHLQEVVFFFGGVFSRFEQTFFFPKGLPLRFQYLGIILHRPKLSNALFFHLPRPAILNQGIVYIVQNPIYKTAGVFRPEPLSDLHGLVDGDLGRNIFPEQDFECGHSQYGPIHIWHTFQTPVLGCTYDQTIQILSLFTDTHDQLP